MGDVFVHLPPQTFDGVQIRAVGRDEMELDPPPLLGQPFLNDFGVMVYEEEIFLYQLSDQEWRYLADTNKFKGIRVKLLQFRNNYKL